MEQSGVSNKIVYFTKGNIVPPTHTHIYNIHAHTHIYKYIYVDIVTYKSSYDYILYYLRICPICFITLTTIYIIKLNWCYFLKDNQSVYVIIKRISNRNLFMFTDN